MRDGSLGGGSLCILRIGEGADGGHQARCGALKMPSSCAFVLWGLSLEEDKAWRALLGATLLV